MNFYQRLKAIRNTINSAYQLLSQVVESLMESKRLESNKIFNNIERRYEM